MAIKRLELAIDRDFTIVRNAWARDGRLSLRARGLLVQLLSHRPGWEVSTASLVRDNPEGRDAIRKTIRELETFGYLKRIQMRDGTEFSGMEYVLQEPPQEGCGFPVDGNPVDGNPDVGESTPKEDYLSEDYLSEDPQREVREPPARSTAVAATTPRPEIDKLCELLADRIEANGSKRPIITKRWEDACRLMLDRDGRTPEQVAYLIDWSQSDSFWKSNILSMPKLRDKFDQLRLQATSRNGPSNSNQKQDQINARAARLREHMANHNQLGVTQ